LQCSTESNQVTSEQIEMVPQENRDDHVVRKLGFRKQGPKLEAKG
jgi:hypothetical protein